MSASTTTIPQRKQLPRGAQILVARLRHGEAAPRKRGAQPGNRNAMKHGAYSAAALRLRAWFCAFLKRLHRGLARAKLLTAKRERRGTRTARGTNGGLVPARRQAHTAMQNPFPCALRRTGNRAMQKRHRSQGSRLVLGTIARPGFLAVGQARIYVLAFDLVTRMCCGNPSPGWKLSWLRCVKTPVSVFSARGHSSHARFAPRIEVTAECSPGSKLGAERLKRGRKHGGRDVYPTN